MKKIITVIFTAILLVCICPISVSAEGALKAPTVQYKLINHDEIALRWTEVEGADGYCIYRTDVKTGKTVKYKEIVTDTTFNATRLDPATDYVFKVAAVSENDGQITLGKKSMGTALTTPDEWYYYFESSKDSYFYVLYDDINKAVMKRAHFDHSDAEDFDMTHINAEAKKNAIDDLIYDSYIEYNYGCDFTYINGYVYFNFEYAISSDDAVKYICRMKNDGSDFEIVGRIWYDDEFKICMNQENSREYFYVIRNDDAGYWDLEDEDYEIIKDFNYFNDDYNDSYEELSEYQKNTGFDIWWLYRYVDSCESYIKMFYYDKDQKINEKELHSEKKSVFSGPVENDKYIYFLSEPLYSFTDKTDTVVYRAKYDGSDLQEKITIPKDDSCIYGDANDGSIQLFDCDGDYLYYYVYGKKASEIKRRNYYTFYRININEEKAAPQKIISVDSMYDFELCNGYLYIETGIRANRNNGIKIYVRIGADGNGLKKQTEPFEWRY